MFLEEVARERVHREHYHELLHEAEKVRRVHEALVGRGRRQSFFSRLPRQVARWLAVQGQRLPARSVADRPLQPRPVVDRTR